jgi:hypothetical protein
MVEENQGTEAHAEGIRRLAIEDVDERSAKSRAALVRRLRLPAF